MSEEEKRCLSKAPRWGQNDLAELMVRILIKREQEELKKKLEKLKEEMRVNNYRLKKTWKQKRKINR